MGGREERSNEEGEVRSELERDVEEEGASKEESGTHQPFLLREGIPVLLELESRLLGG